MSLIVFATGFVLVYFLTPQVIGWAERHALVDMPSAQAKDIHRVPTPRFGGFVLFPAFCATVAVSLLLPVQRADPGEGGRILGVVMGATLVWLLGLYDDWRELTPLPQLVGLIAAALTAIMGGVRINEISNPLGGPSILFPSPVAELFSLFWIVGAAVTINWIDGLDGLASGVVVIAAGILALRTFSLGQTSIALLPLGLAAATLGFLPWNWHPARIFLGGGAHLLGYLIGTLSIIGGPKGATLLLVLAVPILDVAWRILARVRQGRSPMQGDRGHLHQRLFDLGLSQRRVVLLYYAVSAFFGLLAVGLRTPQEKLVALVITMIVLIIILLRIGSLEVRRGEQTRVDFSTRV